MGSTGTQQQHGSKQAMFGNGTQIVQARNLVPAVMVSARERFGGAGTKLFGIANPLDGARFPGKAIIEGGDTAAFLKVRIDRFGVHGMDPGTIAALDEAIVDVAGQIVRRTTKPSDLSDEQHQRIAIEYVTAACCISPIAVEPFASYLNRSRELRQHVKAMKKAQAASGAEAFSEGADLGTIAGLLANGQRAWGNIARLLEASPHLAALRTQFDVPPLFTTMEAWQRVAAVGADVRAVALTEIRSIMTERRTPYVTEEVVAEAIARVQGNLLLSVGNPYGLNADAFIKATEASRIPGVQPDGGMRVGFTDTPAWPIGAALARLNASVTGRIMKKGGQTLTYELEVQEGPSARAPLTAPIALAASRASQSHSAF